jgi:hypothetical protein
MLTNVISIFFVWRVFQKTQHLLEQVFHFFKHLPLYKRFSLYPIGIMKMKKRTTLLYLIKPLVVSFIGI